MALVECPDCGKLISDQATECNQCGRPMQMTRPETEESREQPPSQGGQGSRRSKLPEDSGTALGGIGAGVGVVVMVLHSLAAGLAIAGIAVAAGLWIQYGPYRRRE
jgi:uncharacterized membrane protein YvbJ